LSFHARVGF